MEKTNQPEENQVVLQEASSDLQFSIHMERVQQGPTFNDLRKMSRHERLRPLIEQRKDRIYAAPWKFEPESRYWRGSDTIQMSRRLTEVFAEPDGLIPFQKWLRIVLEDVFVVDAVAVYIEKRAFKKPLSEVFPDGISETTIRPYFRLIDPSTIALIVDQFGNRPVYTAEHPVPFAVQATDDEPVFFSEKELYHGIRHDRRKDGWLWGKSKIEQVAALEYECSQMVLKESKDKAMFGVFEPLIGDTAGDLDWLEEMINGIVMQCYGETHCRFRWLVN